MWKRTILLAAVLLLCGCPKDESATKPSKAEQARIEKEVATRVAAAKEDMKVQKDRLKTIRVVGFILLAGGALGGLIWLQRNRAYVPPQPGERNLQMPTWLDHFTLPSTRVLDLPQHPSHPSLTSPAPQDAGTENTGTPPHRRARRRRHRNRTHRNPYHDATPSDR